MTPTEREAMAREKCPCTFHDCNAMELAACEAAYQRGRRDGIEEAARVAEAEHLEEPVPTSEGDEAYDMAIICVVDAIRALLKAEDKS